MTTPIDLVVACTQRKARQARLRVRDLPRQADGRPDVTAWLKLLAGTTEGVPARDLYRGETWAASLELERVARSQRGPSRVRLWIASAGYGLVSADDSLSPYGATFSPDSPDFVGGSPHGFPHDAPQSWWKALGRRPTQMPPSITELARHAKGDMLVVLSESYLRACQPDVAQAVAVNERLVVISPTAHRVPRLTHAAPPFDARLLTTATDRSAGQSRPIMRGTRMSLNVRTAHLLLDRFPRGPINRSDATEYLRSLTAAQPPLQNFDGDQQDDDAIKAFLRTVFKSSESISKTRLLQDFRRAGNKCEQKRFGRLYEEVGNEFSV